MYFASCTGHDHLKHKLYFGYMQDFYNVIPSVRQYSNRDLMKCCNFEQNLIVNWNWFAYTSTTVEIIQWTNLELHKWVASPWCVVSRLEGHCKLTCTSLPKSQDIKKSAQSQSIYVWMSRQEVMQQRNNSWQ